MTSEDSSSEQSPRSSAEDGRPSAEDDAPPAEDQAPSAEDGRPSAEELFLAGYDDGEPDEFDEELRALTRTQQRGSVLRPILMIVVVLLVSWVIYDWRDDLSYFFASSDPVVLGEASELNIEGQDDDRRDPAVAHNRYVQVSGIPDQISRGGDYEIFRLIGAEIYVQREVDDDGADEAEPVPARAGPGIPVDEHRQHYQGTGRLIAFAEAPERVGGVKNYFGEHYNVHFCEDYSERRIQDMERRQLENVRNRTDGDLSPDQEDRYLRNNPVCIDAYLVQDDTHPRDLWWHVVFSALLGLFALFNVYKLIDWFRDWLRP